MKVVLLTWSMGYGGCGSLLGTVQLSWPVVDTMDGDLKGFGTCMSQKMLAWIVERKRNGKKKRKKKKSKEKDSAHVARLGKGKFQSVLVVMQEVRRDRRSKALVGSNV
jgi:hypothetical protein